MKKGERFNLEAIQSFCETNDFNITEYGMFVIGEHFITCRSNTKDIVVSFIMDGYSNILGGIYECVYSDMK